MVHRVAELGRQILTQRERVLMGLEAPVLFWEVGAGAKEPLLIGTLSGLPMGIQAKPSASEAVAIEVQKSPRGIAFPMGITVGRTANNDVVLDDTSVSRFHAYFQQDRSGRWTMTDAGSRNGTWVNWMKLEPEKPFPVPDMAQIRIGDLQLVFMSPERLVEHLSRKLRL